MAKRIKPLPQPFKTKLKVDDIVVVRTGKDKGKRGKIISFHRKTNAVVIEGINIVKKTLKKTQENQSGGVHDRESPVHISNVMYYHAPSKRGVRIGYKRNEEKKRERYFKTEKEQKAAVVLEGNTSSEQARAEKTSSK